MPMDDSRLASFRKREKEEDADFMKRFGLTAADLEQWKKLTDNGSIYGGPALKRFFGE